MDRKSMLSSYWSFGVQGCRGMRSQQPGTCQRTLSAILSISLTNAVSPLRMSASWTRMHLGNFGDMKKRLVMVLPRNIPFAR